MTEEQLKQGNKIVTRINELKDFLMAFNAKYSTNEIESEYVDDDQFTGRRMGSRGLELKEYPELSNVISEYISNHIKELEKQLEEL